MKVIIDTDPGIDDAMAIFYAVAHPKVELLGLTTTFGNVAVEQATANALALLHAAGSQAPVAEGVAAPRVRVARPYPTHIHGSDGLGECQLTGPDAPDERPAPQFIIDQVLANPGEITLIAIGPLGNLADALDLEPALETAVANVVVMGGAVRAPGNVTPAAEANIFCDPHAAARVFDARWPVTLVSLDVTNQVLMDRALFARIRAANAGVGPALASMATFYINFYEKNVGLPTCRGHDLAAVAAVAEPQLIEVDTGQIAVVTEGIAEGQTLFAPAGNRYGERWQATNARLVTAIDTAGVLASFEQVLSH